MSVKLTVVKYGDTVFGENYIFEGGDKSKLLPITFCIYLLETEGRKILVDAGCDDGSGFPMSIFCTPVEALGSIGISASDITDVIITHAHNDHIQAIGHFDKAKIYIQNEEYQRGKKYSPDSFEVITFEDSVELCRGVYAKKIGGHSKGSSIVLADAGEKTIVLSGDECYTNKNIKEKIPTGASCCREKSKEFVEEYSKDKYLVFTCHDPDIKRGQVGAFEICI